MADFRIKHFIDYHFIEDTKTYNAIEIGCFPPKNGGFCEYFGLYYKKGTPQPTFDQIKNSLFRKIDFGYVEHVLSGMDISTSKQEVEKEVKKHLGENV